MATDVEHRIETLKSQLEALSVPLVAPLLANVVSKGQAAAQQVIKTTAQQLQGLAAAIQSRPITSITVVALIGYLISRRSS